MPLMPSRPGPPGPLDARLPAAVLNNARQLLANGHPNEAADRLRQVLTMVPGHIEAADELACLYLNHNAVLQAVPLFRDLADREPNQPVRWLNYGISLQRAARYEEALSCFDKVITLWPNRPEGHVRRADTLYYLERYAEAVAAYEPLEPAMPEAAAGLGSALQWCGRHQDAKAAMERGMAVPGCAALAKNNLASLLLLLGDLPAGLRFHEDRWAALPGWFRRRSPLPVWNGQSSLGGKTLYIQAEQGLGDIIQFSRYASLAAEKGARVILEVYPELRILAETLPGIDRVICESDPVPDHDLWCPLLSLPHAFGTTMDTIPAPASYLRAEPGAAGAWRRRLASARGVKVGLVWAGSSRLVDTNLTADSQRKATTLNALAPLAAVPGCSFYSLQLGPPANEAESPPPGLDLRDHTGELKSFADTAALIDALDLVITIDTSVAHLTGAMGKPVWLLNRFATDWRWFLDRPDSPWYPSMRIFRQPAPRDWATPIAAAARALRDFAAARGA